MCACAAKCSVTFSCVSLQFLSNQLYQITTNTFPHQLTLSQIPFTDC